MEKLVLVPYEKYQRLLDGKTMEKKTLNPPKRHERTVLKKGSTRGTGYTKRCDALHHLRLDLVLNFVIKPSQYRLLQIRVRSIHERPLTPLYIEKNDTAL